MIDEDFSYGFRHAKFQKYINMMTIMTNCLTSKNICRSLLEFRNHQTLKIIGSTFAWFHENLPDKISYYSELQQKKDNAASKIQTENQPDEIKFSVNLKLMIQQLTNLENEVNLGIYLLQIVTMEQREKDFRNQNHGLVAPSGINFRIDQQRVKTQNPGRKVELFRTDEDPDSAQDERLSWLIFLIENG